MNPNKDEMLPSRYVEMVGERYLILDIYGTILVIYDMEYKEI